MNQPSRPGPSPFLIILAFVGFVSLGFPDAVVGVAWPSLRQTFGLPQSAIGLVFVGVGFGYFISSFFSGRLTQSLGIGMLLTGSTALVTIAMFGYGIAPLWAVFVACAVIHGLGSGAIDSGLNGYAAHYLSVRYMNWLHACYCFGAMLGPLLMTAVLTSGRHYSAGYFCVAAVMLVMSVMFLATSRQWGDASGTAEEGGAKVSAWHTLGHSAVWLHMVVFLLYTGLEASFSQWTFTVLTEYRHVHPTSAGIAVGAYWGTIGLGRVFFGFVVHRIGIDRLLRYCLIIAVGGAILFAAPLPAEAAFVGLILVGIGLAPVFPCLMTRTPQRLGTSLSAHSVGFQVGAAMIGAAAVPGTIGLIVGVSGLKMVSLCTLVSAGCLALLHEVLIRVHQQGPMTTNNTNQNKI
jgi:fucose permease